MNQVQQTASSRSRGFSIERLFAAPLDQVYLLWTDPTLVAQWWGIRGSTIPVCALDVRIGGAWRIDMLTASGKLYRNHGQYLDVRPQELLIYSDVRDPELAEWGGNPPADALHTVAFASIADGTRVTFEVSVAAAPDRDRLLALGIREGWLESFDRLDQTIHSVTERFGQ
jgi:uncharacterized protein YndB with AHSA1/START domain